MANSIKDIYNRIIDEKESMASLTDLVYDKGEHLTHADALLAELNSGSKVAIWRLWAYVTAVVLFFHEKMWDLFKAEVETKLQAIPGTDAWLAQESKKFQYYAPGEDNDFTFFSDGSYGYETVDTGKQIVKRVAVTSNLGNTVVKVAAEDVNQIPIPLTSLQLAAFSGYLHAIQYAGTTVTAASGASDKMKIELNIYYNALISKAVVQNNVEIAISGYLSNLEFDGAFRVIKLVDAIQAVEGVTDITVVSIGGRPDGVADFSPVNRVYHPVSGYVTIDEAPQNALSETIDYRVE